MPVSMPSNITSIKNDLNQPGSWVWLIVFTLPDMTVLRYVGNTEDVSYGGNTYTALNFDIDKFAFNTDGEIPEITASISNIGYALQSYIQEDVIGGTVSFLQVNTDYLAEDYSEDLLTFTISGVEVTWAIVNFTLSISPELRFRTPEDRFNPYTCRHKFKGGRCGYTGGLTYCDRNPDACSERSRFPGSYGGPLSMRREAVRYA